MADRARTAAAARSYVRPSLRAFGFSVVAAAALGAGIALARPLLTSIGGLLFGALGLSLGWLLVARHLDRRRVGSHLRRSVAPNPSYVDRPITLRIQLSGQLPGAVLTEQVPDGMVIAHSQADGGFELRATRRGRHQIGPALARRRDPFELFTVGYPIGDSRDLVIWPHVADLATPIPGAHLSGDMPANFGGLIDASPDDVVLREYRTGDDLRRVHWRASARHGELLVRGEEVTSTSTCTVALFLGEEAERAEWSISLAASWLAALVDLGQRPQLVCGTGSYTGQLPQLLTVLADLELPTEHAADDATATIDRLSDDGRFLLAVLPAVPDWARLLSVVQTRHAAAVLAQGSHSGADDGEQCLQILRHSGWLATVSSPGTTVEQAHAALFADLRIRT